MNCMIKLGSLAAIVVALAGSLAVAVPDRTTSAGADGALANATRMVEAGRDTFRYDTFGSEAFWTDALQLQRAIAGAKNGGVGHGVSPSTALAVGLKVDADKIPASVAQQIKAGKIDLKDP